MGKDNEDRRRRRLVTETVKPESDADAEAPAADPPAAGPPALADEGARRFGDGERAWAVFEVSQDALEGTVTAIALNGWTPSPTDLARELARAFQVQGRFHAAVLRQLIADARHTPVRGRFGVVRGTRAEPGEDGRVELEIGGRPELLDKALAEDWSTRLGLATLDEVLGPHAAGVTVAPGQRIARLVAPTEGTPGKDLHGQQQMAPGTPAVLEAGAHTRLQDDALVAEVFGYLRRTAGGFEVVPPVWVTEDRAHLIHFREIRRLEGHEPAWIRAVLEAKGVVHGMDEAAVAELCADWPGATEVRAIAVAASTPPRHGTDARVEYSFDPDKRAGAVRADGSIDYRERNAAIGIAAGGLIGRLLPCTPGEPGTDLFGAALEAHDGEDRSFTAGGNVSTRPDEGHTAFFSDIDGVVHIAGDTIEVRPVYVIDGDVDFETGNVDVPMDVEVRGSVRSEFEVKSAGAVVVGGTLEPGCRITAGGDVIVAQGVYGDTTQVEAGGDVQVKMIQNATVQAEGDVTAGAYIYNGKVRAGGCVRVESGGQERAGSIVGGEVIGGGGVVARAIGSADTDRTVVGVGLSPSQRRDLHGAEGVEASTQGDITRLVGLLGLQRATPEEMQARLRRCSGDDDRRRTEARVAELEGILRAREAAQETRHTIEAALAQRLATSTVRAQRIYADVSLDFGGLVNRVDGQLLEVEFHLQDQRLRWRPLT